MLKNCKTCGKTFEDNTLNFVKIHCSKTCKSKQYTYEKKCESCKSTFNTKNKKTRYCSASCYRQWAKHRYRISVKCKGCGTMFLSLKSEKREYCSVACRPKNRDTCKNCNGPMPLWMEGQRRLKKYCSTECREQREREKQKNIREYQRCLERVKLAKALRLWRSGMNVQEVAVAVGLSESSGTSLLNNSKSYRKAQKARLSRSGWYKREAGLNARSKAFSTEKAFSDHAAQEMRKVFEVVKTEVRLPRSRRRIDLIVESGLFRFGIELKATCRTARLDQLLGQSLVKCVALGITPVCIIPDDLQMDSIFKRGCKALGVIAGTLSEAMQCMIEASGKQLLTGS